MSDTEYQLILKNIQKEIKNTYSTQKELSIRAGITETQISRILHGQRGITLKSFIRLCYALGKSPNELVGWIDNDKRRSTSKT